MKRVICLLLIVAGFLSCGKDKFEAVPKVKIESLGPKEVIKGQQFRLVASVTDDEGDIKDSVLIVRKTYLTTIVNVDTIYQKIGALGAPTLRRFELQQTFSYGETQDNTVLQNYDGVERELSLGIIVIDAAGHRSEYVESDKILLKKL